MTEVQSLDRGRHGVAQRGSLPAPALALADHAAVNVDLHVRGAVVRRDRKRDGEVVPRVVVHVVGEGDDLVVLGA